MASRGSSDDDARTNSSNSAPACRRPITGHRLHSHSHNSNTGQVGCTIPTSFPTFLTLLLAGLAGLSYRNVEELLAERGPEVDHVTIYRWVQRFTTLFADTACSARHSPGNRWFADETYVKVGGVCGAICTGPSTRTDRSSTYVSARRDEHAARQFFQRAPLS